MTPVPFASSFLHGQLNQTHQRWRCQERAAARARTDRLLAHVAQAEAGLAEATAATRASSRRTDELLRQAAEQAAGHRAEARAAEVMAAAEACRWRVGSEELGRRLADREEECAGLKARLQVRVHVNGHRMESLVICNPARC